MANRVRQIAFDLDTNALQQYYPSNNWRYAYEVIKNHMKNNGFHWIQGSVYVSNKPIPTSEVPRILNALITRNPWVNMCMRDCRETIVGKTHNHTNMFNKNANVPTRSASQSNRNQIVSSMSDWKSRIAERKANTGKSEVDSYVTRDTKQQDRDKY